AVAEGSRSYSRREKDLRSGSTQGEPLVLATNQTANASRGAERRLGEIADRRIHLGEARSTRHLAQRPGRKTGADSPRVFRFNRLAANACAGRSISERRVARRVRQGDRRTAQVQTLWRALGPALAGPGSLFRIARA